MSQKRRTELEDADLTGKEKKKMKITAARTISIQTSSSKTSGSASNTGKLPSTIDVERFVEARAFEIDAMHTAMKTSSASSTHRVWQTLPRHLRRRAASHDVRRVPLRLRDRAQAEMDPISKKASSSAGWKRKKTKGKNRTETLLKRQRDKSWLETHIWHAKRMHMENLWGYRLAVSPTEKSYRPSYRASIHGSILHDASYYSLVEVKGQEKILVNILELCCDPQGPGPSSKRWLSGSRVLETHIYRVAAYPYYLIAPITVIWKPVHKYSPENQIADVTDKSRRNGKGKESTSPNETSSNQRTIWLRFHPSAHLTVMETLKHASSQALHAYKTHYPESKEVALELADLRGHVNVFEVMGPKASQVIKGAFNPVSSDKRKEFSEFWSSLTSLQSSGSLPRDMVIGFTVNDPRLKFPPKNAKPTMSFDGNPETTIILPSCKLAQSDLWDDSIRNGLAKPKYKKKDIDNRRSENTVPGTPLTPLRQDDRIPVLLIQRSVETPESNNDQARHGWTLMFPAGWSMAFFSSLIYTGTRVAGQFERQTQAYEAGTAYFPRDYPFAETYEIYAQDLEEKRKSNWERKPPAKRPNYKKLGVLSPWRADWEKVLGLPSRKIEAQKDGEDVFSTQNDITMDRSMGQNAPVVHPWLLRGSEVTKLFANMSSVFNPSAALFTHVNRLRLKRNMQPLSSDIKPNDFFQSALINVKVTMNLRGVPEDLAAIYSLPDDVYKKWANLIHAGKAKMANQVIDEDGNIIDDDEENPDEVMLANRLQKESVIIGHVTTGHYSLARGEGFAIGAVALARLLDLDQQATRLHHRQKGPPMLVVVRNNNSRQCRVGTLQVVEA